jgi:hypothetical protein
MPVYCRSDINRTEKKGVAELQPLKHLTLERMVIDQHENIFAYLAITWPIPNFRTVLTQRDYCIAQSIPLVTYASGKPSYQREEQ